MADFNDIQVDAPHRNQGLGLYSGPGKSTAGAIAGRSNNSPSIGDCLNGSAQIPSAGGPAPQP